MTRDIERRMGLIEAFYRENRRMPSYGELCGITGLRSKNAAFKLGKALEARGFLSKDEKGRLIPGSFFKSIRMLGTVEAGFPSPAEEELQDTISLDEFLIKNPQASFLLNVTGDSMIDAGILPGDMVIVDRSQDPKNGDIVIAEVDNKWTMKFFKKRGDDISLVPANHRYRPIIPKKELKVAGIVTAVVRKYR